MKIDFRLSFIELLAFLLMLALGDETINDFAGGSNFLILALVTLNLGGTYYARNIVVSVFVMVRFFTCSDR